MRRRALAVPSATAGPDRSAPSPRLAFSRRSRLVATVMEARLFTSDAAIAERLRSLRMHGQGQDKYDNVEVGYNSRLDTLQAAILLEKLAAFPEELAARQEVARRYTEALGEVVTIPSVPIFDDQQLGTILRAGRKRRASGAADCRTWPRQAFRPQSTMRGRFTCSRHWRRWAAAKVISRLRRMPRAGSSACRWDPICNRRTRIGLSRH